jgi:5-methylcytosine-specific restriction endonuclease McrA
VSALPWFRVYHRMIDDEKLRLLAFEDRWHFVALCCLKADGLLDEPEGDLKQRKIAVKMGIQVRELEEVSRRLAEVGLIDGKMNPTAWGELQQRSDNSAERVKRHRQARKDAGLQAQWQPSKSLRQSIYQRDGGVCVYCASTDDLTIDHKVPQKRGGDNSPENLQTACRVCNAKKRDLTHDEYLKRLAVQDVRPAVTRCNGSGNALDKEEDTEKKEPKGSSASGDAAAFSFDDFVESWNEVAADLDLPILKAKSKPRRAAFRCRQREFPDIADWQAAFRCVRSSKFLRGENPSGWKADPDFFLQAKSFPKLVEGSYG